MGLAALLTRPVTIVRRSDSGATDAYGNPVPTVVNAETVGELQQRQRTEHEGELSDTTWLLVLPAGTDLAASDAVEVDGDRYELVGDPWAARHPVTGAESHVEATLRRTGEDGGGS